ncbi:MAG: hypothetical protein AAGI34_01590 [Pseudomonadota bacterium]
MSLTPQDRPVFGPVFALLAVLMGVGGLWLAEAFGAALGALELAALGGVLILAVLPALCAGSARISDHLVAGRAVGPLENALALIAQWVSGGVLLAAAARFDGAPLALYSAAWTAGFLLLAVLLAPYLNKACAATVPSFLARRYGGGLIRPLTVVVVAAVALPLLSVQLQIVGILIERALAAASIVGLPGYTLGVWGAVLAVLALVVPGGLGSLTPAQTGLAVLILVAVAAPALAPWWAAPVSALPTPQSLPAESLPAESLPVEGNPVEALALAFTLALGTAAMPALLDRALATPTVRAARFSAVWALLGVALVLVAVRASAPVDPVSSAEVASLAGALGAGLPMALVALVVAAVLAAALSSAGGLAANLANTLSHDIGFHTFAPGMAPKERVRLTRLFQIAVLGVAGLAAQATPPEDLGATLLYGVSLAASALFAPLVLGIWDRRTTAPGALAGMLGGVATVALWAWVAQVGLDGLAASGDEGALLGLDPSLAGVLGAPLSLVLTWGVSRLTLSPGDAAEDYVDELRIPRGRAVSPYR